MRTFHIITAGKLESWLFSQFEEYEKRLSRTIQIEWHIGKTNSAESENLYFTGQLKSKSFIALDEAGNAVSSLEIAEALQRSALSSNPDMYFLIGGAYGVSLELLDKASAVWSFGKITLPHQIARLLLLEQLYRADSINRGNNYHHE